MSQTVNRFIQDGNGPGTTSEQELYESLIEENIRFSGVEIFYIPRTSVRTDNIFNEDILSSFTSSFALEMMPDNTSSFGGSGLIMGRLGLTLEQEVILFASRKRFVEVTGLPYPNIGDLLWLPFAKKLFEILNVDYETPFYQVGKSMVFGIRAQVFDYTHQPFTTGVPEVDSLGDVLENDGDTMIDPDAQNDAIETEADGILDFSEENPFGRF